MFVHIWRMKGRKRKAEDYERFGRQVTLPALKKIEGCLDAHFVKVFEARKPEYLWLVFWRDKVALEAARTNPSWRDQIKRFEAGNFYKTIPLELVCESLGSFAGASVEKLKKAEKAEVSAASEKAAKREKAEKSEERGKRNKPQKSRKKAHRADKLDKAPKLAARRIHESAPDGKSEQMDKSDNAGNANQAEIQTEDSGTGFASPTAEGE